jgi:uncharacterized YigZ family protein
VIESYRVLDAPIRHEIDKISGSRFIADAAPVSSEEDALAFVARMRAEFHDARHHCWAYRLGPGGEGWRSSDDGEPSGSAGSPILKQLKGHDVTELVVVVTRYFGGTKLGVGGLMRAYGGAAAAALERASIAQVIVTERVVVTHEYELSSPVQGVLARAGIVPVESEYGEEVKIVLEVPITRADAVVRDITEATAARARIERGLSRPD